MTVVDPGLDFWLRYVNAEGGACEQAGDTTLVLLPETLQHRHAQPEDLLVTSDPDIAREDHAVLLSAGHPLLTAAAETVLARGDCGSVRLPNPATRPPDTDHLLAHARDQFVVDHGRIDLTGGPRPGVRHVLRVSSLVTFTLSADDHFQEQVECWMDVPERLPLGEDAVRELARLLAVDHPQRDHIEADATSLRPALAEAHREIRRRAVGRQELLAGQVSKAHLDEVSRAADYYRQIAESLERRRDCATPDRIAAYQARLESTAAERDRRLAEIDDKYRSTLSLLPFRMQLIGVPALRVEVDVRRGDRRYPLELDWLLPLRAFAGVRCPSCGCVGQLVAGKSRLGCHQCQPRGPGSLPGAGLSVAGHGRALVVNGGSGGPVVAGTGAALTNGKLLPTAVAPPGGAARPGVGSVDRPGTQTPTMGAAPKDRSTADFRPAPVNGRAHVPGTSPPPGVHSPATSRPLSRATIQQVGAKLVPQLWERVERGDRSLRRLFGHGSPADALFRIAGPVGPRFAIGIEPTSYVQDVSTSASRPVRGSAYWVLDGQLGCTDQCRYRFRLCWHADHGRPVIDEIIPSGSVPWPMLPDTGYRNLGPALKMFRPTASIVESPQPSVTGATLLADDAVATVLWNATVRLQGLPTALRCLAAWWRLESIADLVAGYDAELLAAAIDRLVRYRCGGRHKYAEVALEYGVDEGDLRASSGFLQRRLQLSGTRPW